MKTITRPLGLREPGLPLGGPGSGNWGHAGRKGKRGGSAPASYQVGITSAPPSGAGYVKSGAQIDSEMGEFRESMEGTPVNGLSVELGRGGWDGGHEPTFVTQYTGNGEAVKALARFGKKYDQDGVLIQRYTSENDPEAQPQNRIGFEEPMTPDRVAAIESMLVSAGLGGWTWVNRVGGAMLMATCIPQWGGERSAHIASVNTVLSDLKALGVHMSTETRFVRVDVMERGNYDAYIR